jgi:hypothetical protein
MNIKRLVLLLGSALALTPCLAPADEEDSKVDAEPLRCLSMASIRSTKVVNDGNVLFYHGRGSVYLNRLERQCLGLARYGKFTYEVHTGARHARLCATDSITVLERTGRGFNCGLGMFEPLSAEEVEALLVGPNRAVISTPVELPKRDDAAEPAPPPEAAPAPQ